MFNIFKKINKSTGVIFIRSRREGNICGVCGEKERGNGKQFDMRKTEMNKNNS